MKKTLTLSMTLGTLLLMLATNAHAFCLQNSRWALQGALVTRGYLGFGLVNYGNNYEVGATISGQVNDAVMKTDYFVPVVFAGLREDIAQATKFAYGLNAHSRIGKVDGERINSDLNIGPYVGLEYMLNNNLMLTGWIDPYNYQYTKAEGIVTHNHRFFNAGGFGMDYLLG